MGRLKMHELSDAIGTCCWIDLAATDARAAAAFYRGLFGWEAESIRANGGELVRFSAQETPVASLYQLRRAQVLRGVPSHWTPYFGVTSADEAAARAARLGGAVVVEPFRVERFARVSLITDASGALLGLWERSA